MKHRATIFVDDPGDEPAEDYHWFIDWLEKWGEKVRVAGYSTGGSEHIWDVAGPKPAIDQIPKHLLCASAWTERDPSGWVRESSPLELRWKMPKRRRR